MMQFFWDLAAAAVNGMITILAAAAALALIGAIPWAIARIAITLWRGARAIGEWLISSIGLVILYSTGEMPEEYEDYPYFPPPAIPSGSLAAAIALRWRGPAPGESPKDLARSFALASTGR